MTYKNEFSLKDLKVLGELFDLFDELSENANDPYEINLNSFWDSISNSRNCPAAQQPADSIPAPSNSEFPWDNLLNPSHCKEKTQTEVMLSYFISIFSRLKTESIFLTLTEPVNGSYLTECGPILKDYKIYNKDNPSDFYARIYLNEEMTRNILSDPNIEIPFCLGAKQLNTTVGFRLHALLCHYGVEQNPIVFSIPELAEKLFCLDQYKTYPLKDFLRVAIETAVRDINANSILMCVQITDCGKNESQTPYITFRTEYKSFCFVVEEGDPSSAGAAGETQAPESISGKTMDYEAPAHCQPEQPAGPAAGAKASGETPATGDAMDVAGSMSRRRKLKVRVKKKASRAVVEAEKQGLRCASFPVDLILAKKDELTSQESKIIQLLLDDVKNGSAMLPHCYYHIEYLSVLLHIDPDVAYEALDDLTSSLMCKCFYIDTGEVSRTGEPVYQRTLWIDSVEYSNSGTFDICLSRPLMKLLFPEEYQDKADIFPVRFPQHCKRNR